MTELRIEEWKVLREELARKQELSERVVLAMAGANFAMLALALSEKTQISLLIALLPTIVTSIGYLWLLSYVYSALRIATYIREVLEPKLGKLDWEGWLVSIRARHGAPVDRYRMVCWAFYVVSLGAGIAKLTTFANPLDSNLIRDFVGRLGIMVSFWVTWIVAAHFLLIRKTTQQINDLYLSSMVSKEDSAEDPSAK